MTDRDVVAQGLIDPRGVQQRQVDAFERLIDYMMTLEAQTALYEDFVDDISWEGTIGVVDQDSVDTLKHELGKLSRLSRNVMWN
jgi:hypothetical protein